MMTTLEIEANLHMILARLEADPRSAEEWRVISGALKDVIREADARVAAHSTRRVIRLRRGEKGQTAEVVRESMRFVTAKVETRTGRKILTRFRRSDGSAIRGKDAWWRIDETEAAAWRLEGGPFDGEVEGPKVVVARSGI